MSAVYPRHHYRYQIGLPPILLRPHYSDPACNGYRTCFRWSTSQKSWRYNFCCKALHSKKLTRMRSELLNGKFFASVNSDALENRWHVNGDCNFSIVSFHCTCAKNTYNCVKIQNTILTPDKVVNVLIYGSQCFDENQYVVEHVITVTRQRWITGESLF